MAKDLTVFLEDRPGTLAEIGNLLGDAGINIDGLCGFPCEGRGVLHILVEDGEGARRTLEGSGITVQNERDVLVLEIEDKPGEFGKICSKIANAGTNIDLCYTVSGTRLVLGADNLENARAAVG